MTTEPTFYDRMVANRPYPDNPAKSFLELRPNSAPYILFDPNDIFTAEWLVAELVRYASRYTLAQVTCTTTDIETFKAMALHVAGILSQLPPGKRLPFMGTGPTCIIRLYRYAEVPLPSDVLQLGETLLKHFGITKDAPDK